MGESVKLQRCNIQMTKTAILLLDMRFFQKALRSILKNKKNMKD